MRKLFAIATGVLVMTSCGSAATPAAPPLPPLTGDPQLLFTSDNGGGAQQLVLWDVRRARALQRLPYGAVSPDGHVLYTVDSGALKLRAIDIRSGQTVATVAIPEGFTFPQGMLGSSLPLGLSPNGNWIALQSFDRASQSVVTRSRYLVIDSGFHGRARMISLDGEWDLDALSNDGQRLYLLQDVTQAEGPYSYKVRLYDLTGGGLSPQVIVDKRLWGDAMSGSRLVAVPSPDQTWLYSLYAFGPNGPFVHALSLDGDSLAWCTDLPGGATGNGNGEQEMLWTMVRSADGRRLYAVNAGEGVADEISVYGGSQPPVVSRTARFAVKQTPPTSFLGLVVNADAKRFLTGGAVLSNDGRTVFALGDNGIYAIDTSTMKVRRQYLTDVPLDSLLLTADGITLFASSSQQNKLFQIDVDTGRYNVLTDALGVSGLVEVKAA